MTFLMFDDDESCEETIVIEECRYAPGTRVGVFRDIHENEQGQWIMRFIGYGTFEGEFLYGDEESGQGKVLSATDKALILARTGELPCARIRLDSGFVVWDRYCWFEEEEEFFRMQLDMDYIEDHPIEVFLKEVEASEKHVEDFMKISKMITLFNADAYDKEVN